MNNFDANNDLSIEPGVMPASIPAPERKQGPVGPIVLFLLYTLIGSLVGVIYILVVDIMPSIYICGALAVLFGILMARVVAINKSLFKIKSTAAVLIPVLIGILIVTYVKWNAFFALNDTRYYLWDYNEDLDIFTHYSLLLEMFRLFLINPKEFFSALSWYNEFGTWSYGENATTNVTGIFLGLIWVGEFLILTIPSIFETFGLSKKAAKPAPLPDEIWSGPTPGDVVPENTAGYAEMPQSLEMPVDTPAETIYETPGATTFDAPVDTTLEASVEATVTENTVAEETAETNE